MYVHVCMYVMCMYACMYVFVCMYETRISLGIWKVLLTVPDWYLHVCMFTYVCMHACMHACMYEYRSGNRHPYLYMHNIYMHVHIWVYIYTYIHTYINTYIHTYIPVDARTCFVRTCQSALRSLRTSSTNILNRIDIHTNTDQVNRKVPARVYFAVFADPVFFGSTPTVVLILQTCNPPFCVSVYNLCHVHPHMCDVRMFWKYSRFYRHVILLFVWVFRVLCAWPRMYMHVCVMYVFSASTSAVVLIF